MKIKLDSGGAQRSKSTRALKHCVCVLASARFVHLLVCVKHLMLHLAEIRMEASGRPPVQHACQRSGYTDHNLGKSTLRYARTAFFFLAHCCSTFFSMAFLRQCVLLARVLPWVLGVMRPVLRPKLRKIVASGLRAPQWHLTTHLS